MLAPDDFDDTWAHLLSELYDPESGRWSRAADRMPVLTNGPLVALDHADALAIGGIDWLTDTPIPNVMRFDGKTERWRAVASLPEARHGHGVARLGRQVLVFGGDSVYPSDEGRTDTLAYDPDADAWRSVGSMTTGRWGPSSVVLADGRLLVTGGASGNSIYTAARGTAEIYDPATETWTETGSLVVPRTGPSLTLLTDGRVMAAAGDRPLGLLRPVTRVVRWPSGAELSSPSRPAALALTWFALRQSGPWLALPVVALHFLHQGGVLAVGGLVPQLLPADVSAPIQGVVSASVVELIAACTIYPALCALAMGAVIGRSRGLDGRGAAWFAIRRIPALIPVYAPIYVATWAGLQLIVPGIAFQWLTVHLLAAAVDGLDQGLPTRAGRGLAGFPFSTLGTVLIAGLLGFVATTAALWLTGGLGAMLLGGPTPPAAWLPLLVTSTGVTFLRDALIAGLYATANAPDRGVPVDAPATATADPDPPFPA